MVARRVQKFTLARMLLLVAAMIWLPKIITILAGVPTTPTTPEPPTASLGESQEEPFGTIVDSTPVSSQSSTDAADSSGFFPLDGAPRTPRHLNLTGTLISPSGGTAIINGQAYREGDMIREQGLVFRLRSVGAGFVELEADGSLYRLTESPGN